jgi:hypothetical protein
MGTIRLIGGTWSFDGTTTNPCELPSGDAGVSFLISAFGAGFAVPDATAHAVAAYWVSQGYPSHVEAIELNTTIAIYRNAKTGMSLQFGTSTKGATLTGVTQCVPDG